MKWISVDDSLPETFVPVLCICRNVPGKGTQRNVVRWRYVVSSRCNDKGTWTYAPQSRQIVKFWTPLPSALPRGLKHGWRKYEIVSK